MAPRGSARVWLGHGGLSRRREALFDALDAEPRCDLVVIGGGANGAGIALDAATRGLATVLFERADFASGTSSRSSKLIHGGVRYLAQGDFGLVREALRERALLLANAPALVAPLRFFLPSYAWFDSLRYRLGLALYDRLAGSRGMRRSRYLDHAATRARLPALAAANLRGAMTYDDAAFDDARLVMSLLDQARRHGAITLNHATVTSLRTGPDGRISEVVARDAQSERETVVRPRMVVNAAGPWADALRLLAGDASASLTPSRGSHVVLRGERVPAGQAIVLPRTPDGRIMFALPWYGHTLVGTTDVAVSTAATPVLPAAQEVEAILAVAGRFLEPAPTREDIVSVFAGLRPLAGVPDGHATARRSREHALDVGAGGMLTVSGGKWTTYRRIAEQALDLALAQAGMTARPCATADLVIAPDSDADTYRAWGDAAGALRRLAADDPVLGAPLHPALPYRGAHYVHAAREELAISVCGALAFHTRALFIDARAAHAIAPRVAALMAAELGHDDAWIAQQLREVEQLAAEFLPR